MKRICCALLALLAMLTLSGCRSAFERDYYYEAPYTGDIDTRSDEVPEIRNYSMLKTALINMIMNHTEKGEFRFSSYNGILSEDLAAACFEIKSENPLGAYAVETLSYDTSYVVSYYVADIYIGYKRTVEELESIVYSSTVEDFDASVHEAVESFSPQLVIRCFSAAVDENYIDRLVRRQYYDDPIALGMAPLTEVTSYPTGGINSIYDIRFLYGADQQRSRLMAQTTQTVLDLAVAAMTETEPPKLALEAANYLSSRCSSQGAVGRYADTAYGALVLHSADSRGIALAYRVLCAALGIDCTVVEGFFGSMATELHFWNIIELDGDYYHVDVSSLAEDPANSFLLNDDAQWGRYIWEVADYPACSGALRYAEVAGIPEEPEEEPTEEKPEPTEAPEESPPPAETEPPQESPGPAESEPPQESPGPAESEPPQESPEPAESEPPQESPEPAGTEAPQEGPSPTENEAPEESPRPSESEPPQGERPVGAAEAKTEKTP